MCHAEVDVLLWLKALENVEKLGVNNVGVEFALTGHAKLVDTYMPCSGSFDD